MQSGNSNREMQWRRTLNDQQLLQVSRQGYAYPEPPTLPSHAGQPLSYPSVPSTTMATNNLLIGCVNTNYRTMTTATAAESTRDLQKQTTAATHAPPSSSQQPSSSHSQASMQSSSQALPKLTIDRLKSCIKPVDRNSNHEIPLPTELEPYFGKGWYCRYYHSTPAWGFIPPKGSRVRRADGFKALMSRLELMEYRKKNGGNDDHPYTENHREKAVAKPRTVKIEPIHSNRVQVPMLQMLQHQHPIQGSRSSSKENLQSMDNCPTTAAAEPYTPYFIYYLLENMRLLQVHYPDIPSNILCNHDGRTNNTVFHDPQEHPRPTKYRTLHLPPYWYSSAHRSSLELLMTRLASIRPVDILSRWHVESHEVRAYCERLAGSSGGYYAVAGKNVKRPRGDSFGTSPTFTVDQGGIAVKKPRIVSMADVGGVSHQDPSAHGSSDVRSPNIFKTSTADENSPRSLSHQVTFESKPSADEGSTTGPPKKRFLNAANEQDCGIGLLAHVASLL